MLYIQQICTETSVRVHIYFAARGATAIACQIRSNTKHILGVDSKTCRRTRQSCEDWVDSCSV